MIERKEVYEWRDALAAFERRWDIPRISDLMPDGFDFAVDGAGCIPVVHALEQEPLNLLRERVRACGGSANLIVRRVDGAVILLAIWSGDDLDRYATVGDLLGDPPGDICRLGMDGGDVRPVREWTVVRCDYPGCANSAISRTLDGDDMVDRLLDGGRWLLLHDDRDGLRFFCPRHLRHDGHGRPVEYDPDADSWPSDSELIPFYETGGCTYPLPLPECEDAILAVLRTKRNRAAVPSGERPARAAGHDGDA